MPKIELSPQCRQAGIGGDLLAPKNEEQQRSYANAKQAYDDFHNMRQPLAHLEEEVFVLRAAHNAAVLNRRYVTYRVVADPVALPKNGIANLGCNRIIIVESTSITHLVLWPDYSHRFGCHSVLCLLKSADAIICHLMVRGNGYQDTAVMDDVQYDYHHFSDAINHEQRRQRREESAAKRRRQKQ